SLYRRRFAVRRRHSRARPYGFVARVAIRADLRFMAAWIRSRGGRLTYAGRISRRPYDAWIRTPEGSAAVAAVAAAMRFSLFGRQRAARIRLWRELANAAAEDSVAAAVQEEADRYLARLTKLAYAEGLPRVAV